MKSKRDCHSGLLKTLTNNSSTDTFAKARVIDQNRFRNGEGGIRTHDGLRHNCLAGSPVQPLLHLSIMAVGVGFEPTMACAITVFKTAAFVHSAIPPMFHFFKLSNRIYYTISGGFCQVNIQCSVINFSHQPA